MGMGYVSKIWVLGMPCMGADRQLKFCLIMMGHCANLVVVAATVGAERKGYEKNWGTWVPVPYDKLWFDP